MHKDYELLFTGTIIGENRPTQVGHLLGHIENARRFFGMTHGHFASRQRGLDERFPDYVREIANDLDRTFHPRLQDWGFEKIQTHEPILYKDEERNEYGPNWPSTNTDYGSLERGFKRVKTIDENDELQIRNWTVGFDYMIRDCAIDYLFMLQHDELTEEERGQYGYIVQRLYDMHAKLEKEQEIYYRKQVEVKSWIIDWLWERGKVNTERGDDGLVRVTMYLKGEYGGIYETGQNLPEAINKLFSTVYEHCNKKEKANG